MTGAIHNDAAAAFATGDASPETEPPQEISERDARQLLADARSPAADPELYVPVRHQRGWIFYFRRDTGPAPAGHGTSAWIVDDRGHAHMRMFGERADSAIGPRR